MRMANCSRKTITDPRRGCGERRDHPTGRPRAAGFFLRKSAQSGCCNAPSGVIADNRFSTPGRGVRGVVGGMCTPRHAQRVSRACCARAAGKPHKTWRFLQRDCHAATTTRAGVAVGGASATAPGTAIGPASAAPVPEIFSPGLLTVEKTVIRFRPAAVSCGRE